MQPAKHTILICVLFASFAQGSLLFAQSKESPAPSLPDKTSWLKQTGVFNLDALTESSGLARSHHVPNAFWTLNDSGNASEVYLMTQSGGHVGTAILKRIKNVDFESIFTFTNKVGQKLVVVADVGDNRSRRKSCKLHFFPEPKLPPGSNAKTTVEAKTLEFTYEDGPHNCEAVSYDVNSQRIVLFEKVYVTDSNRTPGVYSLDVSAALSLSEPKELVAKKIGDFPVRNVTGMDFSADGKRLIVRNYLNAHLFLREDGVSWSATLKKARPYRIILPVQRQGEAICFTRDGTAVIVSSEFESQPVWRVEIDSQLARADQLRKQKKKVEPSKTKK